MKFYGKVGFATTIESPVGSGKYKDQVVERSYFGDIPNDTWRWIAGAGSSDTESISMVVRIVADEYANKNRVRIKYIIHDGQYLKVTQTQPGHPRLTLTIGGVYNGPKA